MGNAIPTRNMLLMGLLATTRRQLLIAKTSVREERLMDKDVRDSFSKSTEMDTRFVVSTQAEWRVDSKYGVDI